MLGLKETLQPTTRTLAEKKFPLLVRPPDLAMKRVCREFLDQCTSRGSLKGLVDANILLPHQASYINSAESTNEWALRLWSFLAKLNWTALHRVGPHLPDPLRVWWGAWVSMYTKSDQPR
jgi:hypothetical protein